jgi:GNAT superfamily N-acetyltransferase
VPTGGEGAAGRPPAEHLAAWIGGWPPELPVRVVPDPDAGEPGWDGSPRGVTGVADGEGRCVVRVPPDVAARLPGPLPDLRSLLDALPAAVGTPGTAGAGVLRWARDVPGPDVLPDAGTWLPASLADEADPRVPPWLRPFGGDVLVALDADGTCLAGVGLKRHHDSGREIAVVTEERARGRGLARRLVAQAARRVLAEGRAVVYLHAPDNEASARVARASGFPDTGWQVVGFWPRPGEPERAASSGVERAAGVGGQHAPADELLGERAGGGVVDHGE